MRELNWGTLYKKGPTEFHRVRKVHQQNLVEDEGDLLCQVNQQRDLVRFDSHGHEEFRLELRDRPDELVVDSAQDRILVRNSNYLRSYDLDTGELQHQTWLQGHHRRSIFADRDGEVHVEEGREVFTLDENLEMKHTFSVPFSPCEVLHHKGGQCWLFEEFEPRSLLLTDEQGGELYRSNGKLERFDLDLESVLVLESTPKGGRRIVREEQGKLKARKVPANTQLAYPAPGGTLLVCPTEEGTEVKLLGSKGKLVSKGTVPGVPYEFFSSDQGLYFLTVEGDRNGPRTHRVVRCSESTEVLREEVQQQGLVAAENAQGKLVVQTQRGVLELDAQGRELACHSNAEQVNCRELTSRPVRWKELFDNKDLKPGWTVFSERGMNMFGYPAPFELHDRPYLTADGTLNFGSGISAEQKAREFEQFGVTGSPLAASSGKSVVGLPRKEETTGPPEYVRVEANGDLNLIPSTGRAELMRVAGREHDKVTAVLPYDSIGKRATVGLESGLVAMDRNHMGMESPVASLAEFDGHLVARAEDGSELVLRSHGDYYPINGALDAEAELFETILGSVKPRMNFWHYGAASKVFELARSAAPSQQESLVQRITALVNPLEGRQADKVLDSFEGDAVAERLEALEEWQAHQTEFGWQWEREFKDYRKASSPTRRYLEKLLDQGSSLSSVAPHIPALNGHPGTDHQANLELLEGRWEDYALALVEPPELLERGLESVRAVRELHSAAEEPNWSVAEMYAALGRQPDPRECLAKYAEVIRIDGPTGLEMALRAQEPLLSDIEVEFDEEYLAVGSHVLPVG